MINLLPSKEKERLEWDKNFRIGFVLETLIICCLLFLWLFLLFSKFNVNFQKLIIQESIKSQEIKIKQINLIKKESENLNNTLNQINQIYQDQIKISEILSKISTMFPSDALLDNFSFDEEKKEIQLVGKVNTLLSLNEIKEKFEGENSFQNVEFTLGSYIPGKPLEFRVKFNLKNEGKK